MGGANAEGGCEGEIRQVVLCTDFVDQSLDRLGLIDPFTGINMKDRPPRIF
jgi:hypothetical protein